MPPVLSIENVRKRFETIVAVDGVSLSVGAGEIVALLGPNGAGKTTLLRMIVGIFNPDEGRIAYTLGGVERGAPARNAMGYLPEERGLYEDMTVLRSLTFFGVMHGMSRRDAQAAARPWLDRLDLGARADDKLKTLSKGNQQKVQFVGSVIHRPALAILDEPFSGLDPVNQDFFLDLLRELSANGTTVVFSAHQMPLVERLAHRVLLISRGREVLHGTVPEIRRTWHAGSRLVLRVADGADADFLARLPAVEDVERAGNGEIRLRLRAGEPVSELLRAIGERLTVTSIRTEEVTLHEIYVQTVATT